MNSSLVVEVLGSAILKLRVVMMVVVMMFVVLVIIVVVVVFVLLVVVVLMVVSSSCSRGGREGWLSVRRILTISYNNL